MTCDVTYDSDGKQVGDAELFAVMKGAMKILNFSEPEQGELWKIIAIVMHLGNINFGGVFVCVVRMVMLFVRMFMLFVRMFVFFFFVNHQCHAPEEYHLCRLCLEYVCLFLFAVQDCLPLSC